MSEYKQNDISNQLVNTGNNKQNDKNSKSDERKKGTKPNEGFGPQHGNPDHNDPIDEKAEKLRQDPKASNVRKNQAQHDVERKKVGNNRPDLQWDYEHDEGKRHHVREIDRNQKSSEKHVKTIKNNDPNSDVDTTILKK